MTDIQYIPRTCEKGLLTKKKLIYYNTYTTPHYFFNFTPQKRKEGHDNIRPTQLRFLQTETNSLCSGTIPHNTAVHVELKLLSLRLIELSHRNFLRKLTKIHNGMNKKN